MHFIVTSGQTPRILSKGKQIPPKAVNNDYSICTMSREKALNLMESVIFHFVNDFSPFSASSTLRNTNIFTSALIAAGGLADKIFMSNFTSVVEREPCNKAFSLSKGHVAGLRKTSGYSNDLNLD